MNITANQIESGETIRIGNKSIFVTEVSVNYGAFGDFVTIKGFNTKTENYIDPMKVDVETQLVLA
jgi:hypothetical protein